MSTLEQDLQALIARAAAEGHVATISLLSAWPPAMGAYSMVGEVRQARSAAVVSAPGAGEAGAEPVDSGFQCAACKAPLRSGFTCDACGSDEAEPMSTHSAAPNAPAWRPVETAPKSAEPVLVLKESGKMAIETGWYVQNMLHAAKIDQEPCYFTHWMPLPPAPGAAPHAVVKESLTAHAEGSALTNEQAYWQGWCEAADWASRDDLYADRDSEAYANAMTRRLAAAPSPAEPIPKPCSVIADCTTPTLCLSVGTCKGYHVMPKSVRDSATPSQDLTPGGSGEAAILAVESAIDRFIEDYEMVGEDESGRDGCYTPNGYERAIIKDAIMGLLSDDGFLLAFNHAPSADVPAVAVQAEPPQWIDDPHDIEQGMMLNPEWLKRYEVTAKEAVQGVAHPKPAAQSEERPVEVSAAEYEAAERKTLADLDMLDVFELASAYRALLASKPSPAAPATAEEAVSDEALGKIAYQGFDSYWVEDCAGKDAEAWIACAKAVRFALMRGITQ